MLAVAFAAVFFTLGSQLAHHPDPAWLLTSEAAWVNHASLVAWRLTWLGYPQVLLPACLALIVVALRYPQWRLRVAVSIVVLLLAWLGADFFQHFFARPRRLDWVVRREAAFSYPSSHAAIATGFYLLWAAFVAGSALRYRVVLSLVLAAVAVGIMWSRLALGAHYLTDIIGGALWAAMLVSLAQALTPINVFGRPAGRP